MMLRVYAGNVADMLIFSRVCWCTVLFHRLSIAKQCHSFDVWSRLCLDIVELELICILGAS